MGTKLSAGVLLACIALALTLIVGWGLLHGSAGQVSKLGQSVSATRDLLATEQHFLAMLERADSNSIRFLQSGDPSFLVDNERTAREISTQLQLMRVLAAGNSSKTGQWLELKKQTEFALKSVQRKTERQEKGEADHADANPSGNPEINFVRQVGRRMEIDEGKSLALLILQYDASVRNEQYILAAVTACEATLLLLLFLAIRSESNSRSELGFELLQDKIQLIAVLGTISEGLCQLDRQGRFVYLNPAGENILGYSRAEIHGKCMHDLIHPQTSNKKSCIASCEVAKIIGNGKAASNFEDWFQRKDESLVAVECASKPLSVTGRVEGTVMCFRDITERKRFATALQNSEERYRTLVEKSEGLICTHDLAGNLLSINEAAAEVFGKAPADLIGRNLREFLAPRFEEQFGRYLEKVCDWGVHRGLMRVLDQNGDELVWAYSNRLVKEDLAEPYVLGHAQDVTIQIHAERELRTSLEDEKNLSRIDFLTGIANRRGFYEAVEMEAKRSKRYKRPFTLAYLDVDNFKRINDLLGHDTGDLLLKRVAEQIRKVTRETDMVARLGGDEFAILFSEGGGDAAAAAISNLQAVLLKLVHDESWDVSFSIGVRTFRTPIESVESMIKATDELMYDVKRNGKNAVSLLEL
jgi:diguanylate cyclase (GGDEF)-like protein/PAS domain S-box-containing protein